MSKPDGLPDKIELRIDDDPWKRADEHNASISDGLCAVVIGDEFVRRTPLIAAAPKMYELLKSYQQVGRYDPELNALLKHIEGAENTE